ncbi:AmmeMemoRadiSam system protein A [Diplocloster hominis]|uniref:AmmeMemoRadiSam system protein A n=1 Tax=Diplocloster hominis TaxID=3079010 RepID=UPI0031BB3682
MPVIAGFMVPHPPLIIPEIGRGDQNKINETVTAYHQVAQEIADLKPETILLISPHNVMYRDYFHIRPEKKLAGNFAQFRAGQVSIEAGCDTDFVEALCKEGERTEGPWGTLGEGERKLDHGTMVPLYFVNQYYQDYKLVSIGLSGLPLSEHYRLGQAIQRTADYLDRKTAIVASGDLSHYLKEDGPYGYHKEGPEYDHKIMAVMEKADFGQLLEFPEDFCSKAGECGHRSFTIMAGALDGLQIQTERLSYQGPFGVGYGVCTYHVIGKDPDRRFLDQNRKVKTKEDPYVALARNSLEYYINTGCRLPIPENLPREMYNCRAGAFVSIHKSGQLRGCIGTIGPVYENIAHEIIENAVSAGSKDPRFHLIRPDELPDLEYHVDILGTPERITSIYELDVKRYGVIVSKGSRRGLLLPDLEGVDTPEQQVAIAMQKAGIPTGSQDVTLERFQVIRHE